MNTGSCHVKVLSCKWCLRRNLISDLFFIILCQFCDHRCIHTIQRTAKLRILKYHRLQRCITGPLPNSEQGTVDTGSAVEPCGTGIAHRLIEIIVSVELNQLAWHACMDSKSVNNPRNTSRNHRSRIIHAIAHCITHTNLDRNLVFLHQIHKFQTKRDNKTVNIRPCNIFQMAPRTHSGFQTFTDDRQIMLHTFFSCHFHFIENVIVRTTYQYASLLHSKLFYQFKILLIGTNPTRNFRKLITLFHTFINRVPIFFAPNL